MYAPYGSKRSGHMGLMTIVPKEYEVLRADMGELVDKKRWKKQFWLSKMLGLGPTSYHDAKKRRNWYIMLELS